MRLEENSPSGKSVCALPHHWEDLPLLFACPEELAVHLEACHHLLTMREGETYEQAVARFVEEHPEARECKQCRGVAAPWATEGA
jgi:hypothetical protein